MARKDATPPGFDLHRAERLNFILEMRKSGASYRAIAQHLKKLVTEGERKRDAQGKEYGEPVKAPAEWDIGHVQVRSEVRAALRELDKDNSLQAKLIKRLELERLDQQLLAAWPHMLRGDANFHWVVLAIGKRRCELEDVANTLKIEDVGKPKDARSALAALLGVAPEQIPPAAEDEGKGRGKKKR